MAINTQTSITFTPLLFSLSPQSAGQMQTLVI